MIVPDIASARGSTEIDALYAQILKRPQDSELNLKFARAAEAAGIIRWALSAYERVTVNDPGNAEAQAGLQRMRRKLQPDVSQVTIALGTAVETNPRYYIGPRRTEVEGLVSAALRDERSFNGLRWRTTGGVAGQIYSQSGDLGYGYAGLNSGPVLDLFSGWSVVPALGGAATYYNQHFYYGEGSVSTTFENASQGVVQTLLLRTAYRSYDATFLGGKGFYAEARARFAFPNVLGNSSVVIFSPSALYSDISGSVTSPILTELQPGAYFEIGGKLEAYKGITEGMVGGVNLSLIGRRYREEVTPGGSKRADTLVVPGASLLFPRLLSYQTDLRFDYRYLWNSSNDATKGFTDHIVTATVIYRFDPTQPFWTQNPSAVSGR